MKFLHKFKGVFLIFLFCFVVPFSTFYLLNIFVFNPPQTFRQGYTLCGVELGGLTKYEAEEKLNDYFENTQKPINIKIVYKDKTWTYDENDFSIKTNIHTILENEYKTNKKQGYFNKIKTLKKANKMGFTPQESLSYTFLGINEKVDDICSFIEYPAQDSQVQYNKSNNTFNLTASKTGLKVDREDLYNNILNQLLNNNSVSIKIQTITVQPQQKEEELKKAIKKQATFSTSYSSSGYYRKNNIKLATDSLNGYCIMPQEEFSFNNAIGKRTLENGYKEANIIKDGAFVKGVGGGVCQVSTTLYNALLLANVNVTEVHQHSLPVSYVKPGLDAMVSWSSADLKFVNTTSLPMYITSSCDGNNLTFNIHGDTKPSSLQIKPVSEIIKKIPSKGDKVIPDKSGLYSDKIMFKGEYLRIKYPKDGYEARVVLEYYENNKLSHKKQIRHNTYAPQQGIVYEGCETLPKDMTLPKDNISLNN